MVVGILGVFLHNLMADWELRLTATALRQEGVSYHVLAQKGSKFKI